jgi:hypothetical protein
MMHVAARDQVMNTLTEQARATLSAATPQAQAVDNTARYIGAAAKI